MAHDRPLGTASWTHPADVVAQHHYTNGALWLGRSPTDEATPIGFGDDRHVLLASGNRGGKGTTFIVNNLALWPGSVVVVDPKGENATLTATRRGPGSQYCTGMCQQVHVLDPFKTAKVPSSLRSRFNPLDAIDPTHPEAVDRAAMIAAAMMVMSEGEGRSWDENARTMLRGLILHVKTAEQFEGKRNLLTVRRLLMHGDQETVDLLKAAGETDIASSHALLWEGLRSNRAFRGIIAGIGATFGDMYATSPKQYWGVLESAQRNTEFLDSEGVQECVSASNFSLADLKTDPKGMSVYLSLPDRYASTHSRWLRMMVDLTISEMEATPGQPACGHRVLMCLDEFAGLDRMKSVENAVAKIAGYGVKLVFVVQSFSQLKTVYKDNWETILANCGLKLFFGVEDYFTREYISKFIGEEEVLKTLNSTNHTQGTQQGRTHTDTHQAGYSAQSNWSQGTQSSVTNSVQEHSSIQESSNQSNGGGRNWNLNLGFNSNKGASWKPGFFFRDDERKSGGSGRAYGGTYGRQSNWNEGTSRGTTRGQGTSYAETSGTAQSEGGGVGLTESVGSSDAESYGKMESDSQGTSQSAHKRRLITEDEIGIFFKRITDPEHPAYPGLSLVLISGEKPIFLRKTNYYDDHQFMRCFDPHPDHQYRPLGESTITISGPPLAALREIEKDAEHPFRITRWLVAPDTFLKAGTAIAEMEGAVLGLRRTTLHVPVSGWVAKVPGQREENCDPTGGFGLRDSHLVVLKNYKQPYASAVAGAVIANGFLESIQQARHNQAERRRIEDEQRRIEDERTRREAERRHIKNLQQQYIDLEKAIKQTESEYHSILKRIESLSSKQSSLFFYARIPLWFMMSIYLLGVLGDITNPKPWPWLIFFILVGLLIAVERIAKSWRLEDQRLAEQQVQTDIKKRDLFQQYNDVRAQLPLEQIPPSS